MLGEGVLRGGSETAKIAKRHKLDHVAAGFLAREGRGEALPVAVQLLHGREVALAYPHDDDRQRRVGCVYDGRDRSVLGNTTKRAKKERKKRSTFFLRN